VLTLHKNNKCFHLRTPLLLSLSPSIFKANANSNDLIQQIAIRCNNQSLGCSSMNRQASASTMILVELYLNLTWTNPIQKLDNLSFSTATVSTASMFNKRRKIIQRQCGQSALDLA